LFVGANNAPSTSASCHGFHKIFPSSDPNSTINRAHLVETCGKCHPGDTANFAYGKIHVAPDGASLRGRCILKYTAPGQTTQKI
jgi:hypothetical protein